MTIFRDELGAWFIVMFTALVTGKVWGWIGDGRVEFLEQQPPANPRLFHARLSISLAMSLLYNTWIFRYCLNTVVQEAKPSMMVMFMFEFAILIACSGRTTARYMLSLYEQRVVKAQTATRLIERRREIRQERATLEQELALAAANNTTHPRAGEPLPSEDDIDEIDIEVPGWAAKGELVLWLDLTTDIIKLVIYVAFFVMLWYLYGFPIHIIRDVLMTARDFLKRLNAIIRYRRAIQEMNRYPDATEAELAQENTCIICREEMRFWDPNNNAGAVDRVRPKKLPCNHILHLGCLKSWLERQQVCPTCRSPVSLDRNRQGQPGAAQAGNAPNAGQNGQPPANPQPQGAGRVFNIGPIRLGFGANGQQVQNIAQQFGLQAPAPAQHAPGTAAQPILNGTVSNLQQVSDLLQQATQVVQREAIALQTTQQELQLVELLVAELNRLRMRRNQASAPGQANTPVQTQDPNLAAQLGQNRFQNLPTFPPAVPNMAGVPNVPGIPPVVPPTGPTMVRHGTLPNSRAIPAGSPDLPEGVVIPEGWSLLPVQRMDGGQARPAAGRSVSSSPTRPPERQRSQTPNPFRIPETGVAPTPTTTTQLPTQAPTSGPVSVVAPNPTLPNWGGASQLFASGSEPNSRTARQRLGRPEVGGDSASSSAAGPAREAAPAKPTKAAVESSEEEDDGEDEEEEEEEEEEDESEEESDEEVISFKATGRATTVEETEDSE